MAKGWIGVDLDGTLAHYDGWKGRHNNIGDPVPKMMGRVKRWLRDGIEVRIFTARAGEKDQVTPVERWLKRHGLPALQITNVKDHACREIWDDRAVQVHKNTGERVGE